MKIIYKGRAQGKTTELIKLVAAENLYMIVKSRVEAERVSELARTMNLRINFPLTFEEFIMGSFQSRGIKGFAIDNGEMLITLLVKSMSRGVPIQAINIEKLEPNLKLEIIT